MKLSSLDFTLAEITLNPNVCTTNANVPLDQCNAEYYMYAIGQVGLYSGQVAAPVYVLSIACALIRVLFSF